MEGKIAWLIVLSFFMLAQSLYMALKIIREKNVRKNNKTENPSHGERLATLEEAVENIKDDIERIQEKLNRK